MNQRDVLVASHILLFMAATPQNIATQAMAASFMLFYLLWLSKGEKRGPLRSTAIALAILCVAVVLGWSVVQTTAPMSSELKLPAPTVLLTIKAF